MIDFIQNNWQEAVWPVVVVAVVSISWWIGGRLSPEDQSNK